MNAAERRTHFRLPKEARVTCQPITYPLGMAQETAVRMIDVSEGGVKLECPGPIDEGSLLQVAISIEGWQRYTAAFRKHEEEMLSKPLTALGRVVRCASEEGGRSVIGVQFLDIWEDHWRAMRIFLDRECRSELSPP